MGCSRKEFYDLQPVEIHRLTGRYKRQREEREFLFAQLTSCVVNFSMRAPKEMVKPVDLMPSQIRKAENARPATAARRRKRADVAKEARSVMQHFMRMG